MKISIPDLIFDKKSGCYLLPCKTYKIQYVALEWAGYDAWYARPLKKGYPPYNDISLQKVLEILEEKHPELFSELQKLLFW